MVDGDANKHVRMVRPGAPLNIGERHALLDGSDAIYVFPTDVSSAATSHAPDVMRGGREELPVRPATKVWCHTNASSTKGIFRSPSDRCSA